MLVNKLLYCSLLVKCYQMKHCKVLPDIKVYREQRCEKYVEVFPKRVIEYKSVLLDFCRFFWHEEEKDE